MVVDYCQTRIEGVIMTKTIRFDDGSTIEQHSSGTTHGGGLAIDRLRLIMAASALTVNIEHGYQVTRNGWQAAMGNVIEPLTGKTYKRSKKGKIEALHDCYQMINDIEENVTVTDDGEE
jgi:hypothetical protein